MADPRPTFTFRELLQICLVLFFCVMGLREIGMNIEARQTGIALAGQYTGTHESRSSRTKLTSNRRLHLVIEATIPKAGAQRLPLRETTPAEDLPEAGSAIDVVWVPNRPSELRDAAAVKAVVPGVSVIYLGLAAVFAVACAWDRRNRRQR